MNLLRRPSRSSLEILEDRIVLATHIWIGPASGGLWSNPANWSGGVPTTGESGGTIVQFNGNVSSVDTIGGLIVDEIHFTAGGNTITGGVGVSLGISGSVISNNIVNDTGTNSIDASLPIVTSGNTVFTAIAAGKVTINSDISGTKGILLNTGTGTLSLLGTNTYTGTTTVNDGTLELGSSTSNGAIPGALVIGNSSGSSGSAVVRLLGSDQIPESQTVTVRTDGSLDLNGFNETLSTVTMDIGTTAAASITTGVGTLNLAGDLTVNSSGTGATGATISGKMDLGNSQRLFTIANGSAASDLTISATISGVAGYAKAGSGTLEVTNSGPSGSIDIGAGTLLLNSSTANDVVNSVVQVGTNTGTTATLKLGSSNQIANSAWVTLYSDGVLNLNGSSDTIGKLQTTSGDSGASQISTGAGTLTLSDDFIQSKSGSGSQSVTISGIIDFGGNEIAVPNGTASSDLVVNAQITGSSGYTFDGPGTMEIRAAGPSGTVRVYGGTLLLNSNGVNDAIIGDLEIGQLDSPTGGTVKLLQSTEIGNSSTITVRSSSVLDLNGFSDVVGDLVLYTGATSGSTVRSGAATLTFTDISVLAEIDAKQPATISGKLNLSSGSHTIDVATGGSSSDLVIDATISGTGALVKAGSGTLEFANTSSNSFTGAVNVNNGTLYLHSSNGLAAMASTVVNIGDGVSGPKTAALVLGTNNQIPNAAAVTVASDGLFNLAGRVETVGTFVVQSKGTLDIGSGTLSTQNFSLGAQSVFVSDLNGILSVTGSVAANGFLSQTLTSSVPVGVVQTLIQNDTNIDAVAGKFNGLAEGAVFGTPAGLFQISYVGGDGNDVTITAVDSSTVATFAVDGKSATFTDVDGDLVTVKVTKGTLTASNLVLGGNGAGVAGGYQLLGLDLDSSFAGAKVSVSGVPTGLGGNGRVNVGYIAATNVDLTSISVSGDLGLVTAGDADATVAGVGKVSIGSMGIFGTTTLGLYPGSVGLFVPQVNSLSVKGDVRGADIQPGVAGTISIGGSLAASSTGTGGAIQATSITKLTIGGSLVAGDGFLSGTIKTTGDLGSVSITGNIEGPARIQSGGKLGSLKVKGAITGESVDNPVIISAVGSAVAPATGPDTAINSIGIGKTVEYATIYGGYDATLTGVNADAAIGKITVGGDFRASSILVGAATGADDLYGTPDDTKFTAARDDVGRFSSVASLIIKGQALGTTDPDDVFGIVAEQFGTVSINGVAVSIASGPRSVADSIPLGFVSAGPGYAESDLYLREIVV